MNTIHFLYRQMQRIKYLLASNVTDKNIIEINRYKRRIDVKKNSYFIKELNLDIPKGKFDFLFSDICFKELTSNCNSLYGEYSFIKDYLVFCFDKFKFIITSKSELSIIEEIFIKNNYKFQMSPKSQYLVLDIGMNVGISSLYFSNHDQVEKVYGFEPFKPTYSLAKLNFKLNKPLASNIIAHNFGLGYKKECLKVKFDPHNKGINSSLFDNPRIQNEYQERILIKPAYDVISEIIEQNPRKEFILKIDTEGAEYEIIRSLFSNRINTSIKAFIIEWHFRGSKGIEQILTDNGFKLFSITSNINSGLIYAIK